MSWYERPYADGGHGGGNWRFPDNPLTWAPSIGTVAGIRIRVHMVFILYIIFQLFESFSRGGPGSVNYGFIFTVQELTVLFASVLLHEFGHCFAARSVGGRADEILLWPLGGLAMVDAPRAPWPQFVTVICGPLVNVVICLISAALLAIPGISHTWVSWNPFGTWGYSLGGWTSLADWLHIAFMLNWIMFLFNMLCPMYPMDSGRILYCAMWAKFGLARGSNITTSVGMVTAILLGLFAIVHTPLNMNLLAIAFFGYVLCFQERQMAKAGMLVEETYLGGDYNSPYSTANVRRPREGWLARWRRRRAEARRRFAAEQSATEQAEVDRILAKVHDSGLASLSRAERRTLETASQRQRDRESTVR